MKTTYMTHWAVDGEKVRLTYTDGTEFFVRKNDFNRAFGCIINGNKDEIRRDFAIA